MYWNALVRLNCDCDTGWIVTLDVLKLAASAAGNVTASWIVTLDVLKWCYTNLRCIIP